MKPTVGDVESPGRIIIPPPGQRATIVQLLRGTEGGGIITAISHWAPALIEAGWRLRFLVLAEGQAVQMLRHAGFDPVVRPLGKVGRFTRLAREIRALGADVIHCHHVSAHLMAVVAARNCRAGIVRTIHADMFAEMEGSVHPLKIKALARAVAWAWPRTAAALCVSPHLIGRLPIQRGFDRRCFLTLPNGYDPSVIESVSPGLDAELAQWLADDPMVLSMGRLVGVKNYSMLLRAWCEVLRAVPKAKLVLAGSGPLREKLQVQRLELGLMGSVRLLAWVDDVGPLLQRCAAVAISSISECCPMLVLEAMAAAKPVVATSVGGIPYLVDDGKTGLLVPDGDGPALAEALREILGNPDLADQLGRSGRAVLDRRFSHLAAAARHARLYQAVLECRTPTAADVTLDIPQQCAPT